MKRGQWMLFGLLITPLSSALAQEQALVTIDPNNFATGQNISNATTGAQLLSFSAGTNPDPSIGGLVPLYLPVFAESVTTNCSFGVPCALGGNLAFGFTASTIPSSQPILWGPANVASKCIIELQTLESCDGLGELLVGPVLRVNFTVPTNFVTAVVGFFDDDGALIEAFQAFNDSGELIAKCDAFPPFASPPGCATAIVSAISGSPAGWAQLMISSPNANMSFVLIGGSDNFRPIAQLQFNSPVSLQLAGLLKASQGIGPGKSLAQKAMEAQAEYLDGDVLTTCSLLTSFAAEVNAQDGKHVEHLTALRLLSTSTAIEIGIGCN